MKTTKSITQKGKRLVLLLTALPAFIIAQDNAGQTPPAEPVKNTFDCPWLINNQTVDGIHANAFSFIMQHRFGTLDGPSDLFGIYSASANIRLGINYGITNRLSVGVGVTKDNMLYDFEWKYILLRQTPGKSPVTVAYYGNVMRSASPNTAFINESGSYSAADRYSYFNEIMVARKFSKAFSLQGSFSYTHLNIVDSTQTNNIMGFSVIARYKFSVTSSVQVEYDFPITLQPNTMNGSSVLSTPQKPNPGIGYSTGNHQFQLFLCAANNIASQQILAYNTNDFFKSQYLIGFNITRLFD